MDGLRSVPVTARIRGKVTAVVCYTLLQSECSRLPVTITSLRSVSSRELGIEASERFWGCVTVTVLNRWERIGDCWGRRAEHRPQPLNKIIVLF